MFSKIEIPKVIKHRSVNNSVSDKKRGEKQSIIFKNNRLENAVQRKMQDIVNNRTSMSNSSDTILVQKITTSASSVIQKGGDYYAYGSADTTPHIHVYSGGDCHLKIRDRGRIRRYNIVQNGKRHSQADTALDAAADNQALVNAINVLL